MAHDIRERLEESLRGSYAIERELGGGGMSRVFVATETALGRRVVIKVLHPELALGVSVDRFQREIRLSAALQHPHIVPVHATGATDGLPWYTMPYVDGESLRSRLGRGPMAIGEIVPILRDVAKALAFAHAQGVVHRDIKPDNVLLSGGSATVADFGIAKAVAAARSDGPGVPGGTLTQLGTAIGTPTYMAPEQAAGDPSTDHRADLYAFGAMAYEMLAGRAPFAGLTPHRLLAAHMGERPTDVTELRADVPPSLASLVMRCLAKEPGERPQSAGEVAQQLEGLGTGASHESLPAALRAPKHALPKALALWAAATVAAYVLAKAAIVGIGLPDWVLPATLVVMALGLPAILFTHFVQRQTHRALITTPTLTPGGSHAPQGTMATIALKASPHVSWRRTTLGGVAALALLIAATGGWMTLRAMGIGPAGSLMAAGKMGERERVVIAEFASPASDSLLGATITEAFRADLAQSANLSLLSDIAIRDVLRRMQRPPDSRLDFALAREIATREGMKAVIDGKVTPLGGRYVLTARLVSAQTGEEYGVFTEQADDEGELIPAIGRLSKALRSKLGESLVGIQRTPALERVTTPSLLALQKYVAGSRANEREGDFEKAGRLMEEAVAIDSNFAMAYRRLAIIYSNQGVNRQRARAYMQRAYDLRDRLSDAERYITIGSYFGGNGPKLDEAQAIAAYEALLEIQPDNTTALNNLANMYRFRREYAKAEAVAARAIASDPNISVQHNNLIQAQLAQGKFDEADRSIAAMAAALPGHPGSALMRASHMEARAQFDSIEMLMDSLVRARPTDQQTRRRAHAYLASVAQARGRLAETRARMDVYFDAEQKLGGASAPLNRAVEGALRDAFFRGDLRKATATVDGALAELPFDSLDVADRPYYNLGMLYGLTGQTARLRALIAEHSRATAETQTAFDAWDHAGMEGWLAIAEKRHDDAIAAFRRADTGACPVCELPTLAQAYDLANRPDSAIAVFERYLARPFGMMRLEFADRLYLAGTHKRLGELYDAKGDRAKAASHYAEFVELWKDADPELQPQVTTVRNRLRELQRAERP